MKHARARRAVGDADVRTRHHVWAVGKGLEVRVEDSDDRAVGEPHFDAVDPQPGLGVMLPGIGMALYSYGPIYLRPRFDAMDPQPGLGAMLPVTHRYLYIFIDI